MVVRNDAADRRWCRLGPLCRSGSHLHSAL
jgi:hypothetical protein